MEHIISRQRIKILREKLLPDPGKTGDQQLTVYAMAGIPACGKTTFVNSMLSNGQFPKDAYILNPDQIMEILPEYQRDHKQLGAEEAFTRWEMPARSVAYLLLEEAIKLRIDIIQDMGSARWENHEMLKRLKEQHGYYLKMYWIEVSIDTVWKRLKQRKRFIPESMVLERAEVLRSLKPHYIELVDEFIVA